MVPLASGTARWRAPSEPMHDGPVIGRFLAICGWLAWQVRRRFPGRPSALGRAAPVIAAILLVAVAAVPVVLPLFDAQPNDATVQMIIDDAVREPTGWVRLRGRVVPLPERPTDRPGQYAVFVDAADRLQAIVVRSDRPIEASESIVVTGHVAEAVVLIEEDLPIEATVFGAPPEVVGDRIVELDAVADPVRVTPWPLAIPLVILAALLIVGARIGYPVFRQASEIDVLSAPLGPGERLPAVWGGRIGPNVRDLADPGGVLLVVRPGPQGNLLTAQPLPEDGGPAPQPVTIGGGWTTGRLGYVHAVSETVPALLIRSELVDATFLFARVGERDRVAALVAVERT